MPLLVDPVMPQGTFRNAVQPWLTTDDGLLLRPWQPADTAMVQTAFACPDIQRWHVRRLDSSAEAGEWVSQWATRWEAETAASWVVVDADSRLLGQVGLRDISLEQASAALSYWVTPAARGAAVAARSVAALTAWAFTHRGFNRLSIHHSTLNVASCRTAERSGYPHEGTLRQAVMHADGWHDWHVHGRLRTDA